jgi:hypothetical protein
MALVMVQQPEARLEKLRKRLEKSIGDKHEEVRTVYVKWADIHDVGHAL